MSEYPRVPSASQLLLIGDDFKKLQKELARLQTEAINHLPGVAWDFSKLQDHLGRIGDLLKQGLALKAYNEHLEFTVTVPSPGKLLVKLRGKTPDHIARRRGYLGGKSTSQAKTAATRQNLELARSKRKKAGSGENKDKQAARIKLKGLRQLFQRLKYRESCAAEARQLRSATRAPRSDLGKRAQRIEQLREEVRLLEEKWPSLRSKNPIRSQRTNADEAWLIPPPATQPGPSLL